VRYKINLFSSPSTPLSKSTLGVPASLLPLPFNRKGDCLAAKLPPGSVHSADDWEELLLPRSRGNRGKAIR